MAMTTSSWGPNEITQEFGGCSNLRELIRQVESNFAQKGEVVCEIRVNGMMLTEADEAKFAESPLDEIRDLLVCSNRPGSLISEALASAESFIPQMIDSCLASAEAFRGANLAAAQQVFSESLEGCTWLVETLAHVRGAASGLGKPITEAESWFEAEKAITQAVREVTQGYEKKDFVLVADVLEYEVTAALEIWSEAIKGERAQWV
jgi:hypothetical protein